MASEYAKMQLKRASKKGTAPAPKAEETVRAPAPRPAERKRH